MVAALEGSHALATGELVPLSEQNVVDCSGRQVSLVFAHITWISLFLVIIITTLVTINHLNE